MAEHRETEFENRRRGGSREVCPSCGGAGKRVPLVTVPSLVVEEARGLAGRGEGYRFCPEPSCEVAYYHPQAGVRIGRSEVRVRIGSKETEAPRPICYCFDHTIEEIEAEVAATGTSRVPDEIREKCRRGLDRCAETNPQGSCCLGNVRRVVREAQARREGGATGRGGVAQAGAGGVGEGVEEACCAEPNPSVAAEDCCAAPSPPAVSRNGGEAGAGGGETGGPRKKGLWVAGAAVVTAVVSSACCWLPLLLVGFGASAAGVSGFFEAYRPYLLGATAVLLAGGFYLVYFRRERCAPGEACAVPHPRLQRLNEVTLWVAAIAAGVVALFPTYAGSLLDGKGSSEAASFAGGELASTTFHIEGMSCEACAATIRRSLESVPGVAGAEVSYDAKTAKVFVSGREGTLPEDVLVEAVRKAGYRAVPAGRP